MKKRYWLAAAIIWTLLIMVGCWLPTSWFPEKTPDLGGALFPFIDIGTDKLIHFAMFCGFAFLWSHTLSDRRLLLAVALGGLALAALTELGQSLPFIGRESDWPDAYADLVGIAIGLIAASAFSLRPTANLRPEPDPALQQS